MSDISIKARGVSKMYRIGHERRSRYVTLRDQLASAFSSSIRRATSRTKMEKAQKQEVWALKDVTFDIRQGEVVGLIGPNGAGKSTLLKILTRITEPTHGAIDIYGRIGSLLEVGTGFHKELTGRDNVYLNGAILGMKKQEIDRKFDEIISFSEVEKYIDTPVKFYSSGMTVRLAFAVAAHLEPEILLVDEVLAVGDASFQKKSITKMESVGKSGRTVIFVSHHMPSITRLCERALLLNHGQVQMDGPAEEVVASYLSANLGVTAYREWADPASAPGSEVTRLRSVRAITEAGETCYSFDIRKPVGIEIVFDVLSQQKYAISPYLSFHNEEEVWVFTSIDTDREFFRQPRRPGRYRSVAWVPGNLLAEGVMSIGVGLRTEMPYIIHGYVRDAVAFQVVDSAEGDTARMDYAGKFRGVVRPMLNWTNEYFENSGLHAGAGRGRNGHK